MPAVALAKAGVPDWIRTNDLRIRNPLLYPAELRAHYMYEFIRYKAIFFIITRENSLHNNHINNNF